jgi:transcriptional regulator with XRE-family HTH domain
VRIKVQNLLAQVIRKYRKKKGLTQIQLAEALGVSNVMISNYEIGRRFPPIIQLLRMANYLGFSLKEVQDAVNE